MNKLYFVEKTVGAYVLAGSEKEAKEIALSDESGCDVNTYAVEIHDIHSVPILWRDSLPFTGDAATAKELTIELLLTLETQGK